MFPAMVCIKCFGSTKKTNLVIREPETLQGLMCNPAGTHRRVCQEMVCKVADEVPLLRHAGVIF